MFAVETEAQRKVLEKYYNKRGSLRGLVFEVSKTGTKGEGTGTLIYDSELSNEDIAKHFTNAEYKNEEGKVLKAAGQDTQVFDYAKLFPPVTASELRSRYGLSAPIGSKDDIDAEVDDNDPPFTMETFDESTYDIGD